MTQSVRHKLLAVLTGSIAMILLLVPFHAFVTVWLASGTGHYTAWRLWDEVLLALGFLIAITWLWLEKKTWQILRRQQIVWLIGIYAALQLLIGGVALARHDVSLKALGYGLIVNLRFLLFFLLALVVAHRSDWLRRHWRILLLAPAAVVVAFGLLQYFILPFDVLRHFGYSANTIFPYETINHNLHYVRVMSTLRGANPLGAYLIIVACALVVLVVREKNRRWLAVWGVFLVGTLATLYLSFSRSAWIGAALGIVIIVLVRLRDKISWRLLFGATILIVAIGAVLTVAFHNNVHFQNLILHTQQHSAIKTTSDQGHASALRQGVHDAVRQPFGEGPGTAGPASIYNTGKVRIAENYFVQVAQEVGWLGLIVFIMINWLVAKGLWLSRADSFSLALLASLIGITFVNLLSHAWVDDTLSYVWWGLAGIALALPLKTISPFR